MLKNNRKQVQDYELAKQFLIMDICEIMSCLMITGLGMRYLFDNLNEYYNVTRFLLRTTNLFFQLLIPIVTVYYNKLIWLTICFHIFNIAYSFNKSKSKIIDILNKNLDLKD
jgi:hypothetical protein